MTNGTRLKRPHKIVEISWVDSNGSGAWAKGPSLTDDLRCLTTGYLLAKTEDRVVIASSWDGGSHYCAEMAIPIEAVRSIRTIKKRRER